MTPNFRFGLPPQMPNDRHPPNAASDEAEARNDLLVNIILLPLLFDVRLCHAAYSIKSKLHAASGMAVFQNRQPTPMP
jgi:hypothetical protein